jgi:hypothetical protein
MRTASSGVMVPSAMARLHRQITSEAASHISW